MTIRPDEPVARSPLPGALPAALPPEVDWLFFDLDGTLWDHGGASLQALRQVCDEFHIPADAFIPRFEKANDEAWGQLEEGLTTRDRMRVERFQKALAGIDPAFARRDAAERISGRYLEVYLTDPAAYWIETGHEVLEAAARAGKRVALLTNGFSDTQFRKVELAGEAGVIEFIWGPEEAGCLKPRRKFYTTALERAGCEPVSALMIGDSLTSDVLAPLALGLKAWWFNPGKTPLPPGSPSFPIFAHLRELLPLFNHTGGQAAD